MICYRCEANHAVDVGMTVYVFWHDGVRQATVSGIREHDRSVRPGCLRVYLPGPALGRYDIPFERVRSDFSLATADWPAWRAADASFVRP